MQLYVGLQLNLNKQNIGTEVSHFVFFYPMIKGIILPLKTIQSFNK